MPPPNSLHGKLCREKGQPVAPPYFNDFAKCLSSSSGVMSSRLLYSRYRSFLKYKKVDLELDEFGHSDARFYRWMARCARDRDFSKCNSGYYVAFSLELGEDNPDTVKETEYYTAKDYFADAEAGICIKLPFDRCFVSRRVGHGAFANRNIQKGEVVCEYGGSFVSEQELCEREDRYAFEHKPMGSYKLFVGNRLQFWDCYVDKQGRSLSVDQNPGVWLNSVDLKPVPGSHASNANCKLCGVYINGVYRLIITALYDIPNGAELIHNYNANWWND